MVIGLMYQYNNKTLETEDQENGDLQDRVIKYPREATIFASVCCIIFIIVGCLGNLVTILALSRSAKLRNATTAFVFSLCMADFLFCAFNLPLTASRYIHEKWVLGDTLCFLFPFFFYGNVAASLMSMTAITINRFILINHPNKYEQIYKKRYIALMIAFSWIFSFVLLVPTLTSSWGTFGLDPETFSCTILKLHGKSPKKFLFVLGFLIPCVVIIISYSCIFFKVRRTRENVAAHSPPVSPTSPTPLMKHSVQKKDELRITCMMLTIFISFLICFLPLMIVNVFDNKVSFPTIHVLASTLAWMSSCINPVIYALMNRTYRKAYYQLFRCCSWKRPTPNSKTYHSGSNGSHTVITEAFTFPKIKYKDEDDQV
ncbi:protein trapped in endoderm-1-like isoform X1 [Tachypleus tridentatus]|uniref:protein trapped in endoderm-1-like isoform X1 n=1 Tax=Tachypleus tridentatus TaxID=6853 RepID=UPI003FD534BB